MCRYQWKESEVWRQNTGTGCYDLETRQDDRLEVEEMELERQCLLEAPGSRRWIKGWSRKIDRCSDVKTSSCLQSSLAPSTVSSS